MPACWHDRGPEDRSEARTARSAGAAGEGARGAPYTTRTSRPLKPRDSVAFAEQRAPIPKASSQGGRLNQTKASRPANAFERFYSGLLRLFHELAQDVCLDRAEQAELNAEAAWFDPTHHRRQPELLLCSRQEPDDRKLGAEGWRMARLEEHAADAHVFALRLERGAAGRFAAKRRLDRNSLMRAFVVQGLLEARFA